MIKKSFSMIELIFVIIIVSIISVVVTPKFCGDACGKNSDLVKAANQVLSDIRYTRHLAMIDNKFVPNPDLSTFDNSYEKTKDSRQWFKKWWQIYFYDKQSGNQWCYAVFSDSPAKSDISFYLFDTYPDNPNNNKEVAASPLKKDKYMIGSAYGSDLENDYSEDMNLTKRFSISKVSIDKCSNHILFDNFGRPHCSKSKGDIETNPYNEVITSTAKITLYEDTDSISICVEAETGYSYIAYDNICS